MEQTLDKKINQNVISGLNNKAVKTYLKLIDSNNSTKMKQVAEYKAIQQLFEAGFDIGSPDGSAKLNSQRLYQALWRTANRMKPLDFMIHGSGREMYQEMLTTQGVGTVLDRGGYDSALRDKNGVFMGMLLYGDHFIQVGANPEKKSYSPLLYTPIGAQSVYMDNFSTGLRNRGKAGSAYRVVTVFSYPWNQACEMWPELEKIGGVGKLPRQSEMKAQERTQQQEFQLEDEVEIGFGWDSIARNFTIFAGSACTVLEEFNGDEYPFITKDDCAYIPLFQFICVPSSEGPFNKGLGHLLYKLAVVTSRLLNLELGHAEDNVYPITLVSMAQSEADTFFGKLAEASRQRAAGKKPFVAMEYDPNNPNSNQVQAQSLTTAALTNEWQLIYNTLIDEIQMLGINLKELTTEGNPTATEILSDEENSNSWVKQTMEYNASETQAIIEITLDAIAKFVSVKSQTPLNLTSEIEVETEEGTTQIRPDGMTMGMLAKELKDNNYFVKVNSRTGAIPSNSMLRAKINQVLPYAQPGTKAYKKLMGMMSGLSDIDLQGEDFLPEQMAAPQMGGAPTEEMGGVATETDRMSFFANRDVQTPVI